MGEWRPFIAMPHSSVEIPHRFTTTLYREALRVCVSQLHWSPDTCYNEYIATSISPSSCVNKSTWSSWLNNDLELHCCFTWPAAIPVRSWRRVTGGQGVERKRSLTAWLAWLAAYALFRPAPGMTLRREA
jgi:hypothetical protein